MKASRIKTDTVDPTLFAPGQRWLSETQTELGLGLVISCDFSTIQVQFPAAQQTITYASRNAPLRRVFFEAGDTIETNTGEKVTVSEVRTEGKCLIYVSREGREIPESLLSDTLSNQRPEQKLLSGSCDDGRLWSLRQATMRNRSYYRSSEVRGLIGGRISLIPHQLYIAEEVAKRYAPRVLLADEVGLGKTIEACLTIHRLHLCNRARRILILVPEPLVNQWFVELYRRFSMTFAIYDEERVKAIELEAKHAAEPAGNPFFEDQHVLTSASWLVGNPTRSAQIIEGQWDLLIVDEAHHLVWSEDSSSPEYDFVAALAEKTPGVMLLTATPEQLGREGHFARLRLLDPDRFSDLQEFVNESRRYHEVSDLADYLGTDTKLEEKHFNQIADMLGEETAAALKQYDTISHRIKIQNALVDLHGPGRVLFRNRRMVLDNFPKRVAHLAPLSAVEDQEKAFKSKIQWLFDLMRKNEDQKFLLIVHSKEEAKRIEQALAEKIHARAALFHEDLTLLQRDKNAAWFADPVDGARILICSEIGSEGRNFQFVQHLILFDLPDDPSLLEQRIGRLDRIGQTGDVHIHVPFVEGSPDEMLALWYHKGLGAFEQTVHGAEILREKFKAELEKLRQSDVAHREEKLPGLINRVKAAKKKIDKELEKGRDRLLELSSYDEERGRHLVRQIQERDEDLRLEALMLKLFDHFGVTVEDVGKRSFKLSAEHLFSAETFPGLPRDGVTVTFDRKEALNREDIVFLTSDHPMVIGAIDSLLASDLGNAAFFKLENAGEQLLLVEVVSVLECITPEKYYPERFLSPQPIRALVDQSGRNRSMDFPVERIRTEGRSGPIGFLREKNRALRATIPPMLEVARNLCDEQAEFLRNEAVERMENSLSNEISRLKHLKKQGHPVRDSEIKKAEEEMDTLRDLLRNSTLRVDSVRIILALA